MNRSWLRMFPSGRAGVKDAEDLGIQHWQQAQHNGNGQIRIGRPFDPWMRRRQELEENRRRAVRGIANDVLLSQRKSMNEGALE